MYTLMYIYVYLCLPTYLAGLEEVVVGPLYLSISIYICMYVYLCLPTYLAGLEEVVVGPLVLS
jgi:hypothetical protein